MQRAGPQQHPCLPCFSAGRHLREQRRHLAPPQHVAQLQLQQETQLALGLGVQHVQPGLGATAQPVGGRGWPARAPRHLGTPSMHAADPWITPPPAASHLVRTHRGVLQRQQANLRPIAVGGHTCQPASTSCFTARAACRQVVGGTVTVDRRDAPSAPRPITGSRPVPCRTGCNNPSGCQDGRCCMEWHALANPLAHLPSVALLHLWGQRLALAQQRVAAKRNHHRAGLRLAAGAGSRLRSAAGRHGGDTLSLSCRRGLVIQAFGAQPLRQAQV
jgi:hypothetical protein